MSYNRGYFSGVATFACVGTLFQDYIGRVEYSQLILDHWTEWYYSTPPAIAMLLVVAVTYIMYERPVFK